MSEQPDETSPLQSAESSGEGGAAVTTDPAHEKEAELFSEVLSRLDIIISLLERLTSSNSDSNPWTWQLAMEYNTGVDRDGNDMIYGKDFIIGENLENVPPTLRDLNGTLSRDPNQNTLWSWETYLDSIRWKANGEYLIQVSDFVGRLGRRLVTETDESGARSESTIGQEN